VPDRKVEGPAMVEPASDYPVPPLDLVVPSRPRHRLRRPADEAQTPTRLH
jgi:NADH-quinone oxidoreductase subunit H